jgi:hypothetical protein
MSTCCKQEEKHGIWIVAQAFGDEIHARDGGNYGTKYWN